MSNFRIMLMSTAAIGIAGTLATSASAGEVERSASFSGMVNRIVSIVDDGDSTDLHSDTNTSLVNFTGAAKSENLTITAVSEVTLTGAASDQGGSPTGTAGSAGLNQSYVSLSNNMGTLLIGETNSASDLNSWGTGKFSGASGNGVDGNSPIRGMSVGFVVKNAGNTTGQEEGLTTLAPGVSNFYNGFASGGTIRYQTPDFNGFNAAIGIEGGADAAESSSASAGYSADFDGTAVAVGVSYVAKAGNSTTVDHAYSVGAGFELASGINFHAGYGKESGENAANPDEKMWTVDVGYDMSVVDAGTTSIVVNYTDRDDVSAVNDSMKWYGVSVQQELTDYGTSIYGGVSTAEYNTASGGTQYEDLTAGWVGIKVSF